MVPYRRSAIHRDCTWACRQTPHRGEHACTSPNPESAYIHIRIKKNHAIPVGAHVDHRIVRTKNGEQVSVTPAHEIAHLVEILHRLLGVTEMIGLLGIERVVIGNREGKLGEKVPLK